MGLLIDGVWHADEGDRAKEGIGRRSRLLQTTERL